MGRSCDRPRLGTVAEAALGFTFLGLVIGYPPLLYQHFSSREMRIAVLDARAGTSPSAAELVIRQASSPAELVRQLGEWEPWEGEVLQSQLSYPMLAYFRSQHTNQSWLATLTAVVDTSALILIAADGDLKRQAQFTFALGRHALVDLALVFRTPPFDTKTEHLSTADCLRLRNDCQARIAVAGRSDHRIRVAEGFETGMSRSRMPSRSTS